MITAQTTEIVAEYKGGVNYSVVVAPQSYPVNVQTVGLQSVYQGGVEYDVVVIASPVYLVNVQEVGIKGEKGDTGEGIDNFTANPLAFYILAKN